MDKKYINVIYFKNFLQGIADFVPNELRPSSKLNRNKPLYEPFTKLSDRAKQWIRCAPVCISSHILLSIRRVYFIVACLNIVCEIEIE